MRNPSKVNLIIGLLLLVAAIVYTVCYTVLHLYVIDHWRNILVVGLWALAAVVLAVWFAQRSLEREELIRRYYLSRDWIYNHEIGYAPLSQVVPDADAYEFVTFAADALVEMSYGFEVAETPDNFEPDFMVSTTRFDVRQTGDGAVVAQWKGALHRVVRDQDGNRGTYEIAPFENAAELAQLLEENEALA
ncbi:MAG: hypothetical protein Q3963_02740 [Coriobacteriaceae bacterium]|nr:hypothetical protein [Coriobacteriaceae bacterium]